MPTAYDRVLYPGMPFPQTHPDRLATMATLFGVDPPPVERCRVLELACGDGGNLIPMAFGLPGSEFLGIDLAGSAIDIGLAAIDSLGLRNIRLEQMDILETGPRLGRFDYIIAHGIYSWAPEPVRDKVVAIAAGHLAPQGVAYVSYNALPGCRTRQMLRDMLLFHLRGLAEPEAQLESARALLRSVIDMEESRGPQGLRLKVAAQALLDKPSAVLFHDELGEVYQPVLFHDFVADAARHGLQFLAEANYSDMQPRDMPDAVAAFVGGAAGGDRVARQQYFDFFRNRAFRQTLLCHERARVPHDPLPERVSRLFAASAAKPASPDPDLRFGAPEEFRTANGAAITAEHPVVKAVMIVLSRRWPEALSFDELTRCAAAIAADPVDTEGLSGMLLAAYGSGLVEFHTVPPRCVSQVSNLPEVSALARWQAARGMTLTTARHTSVELSGEVERRLVSLVDGARDVTTLSLEMARIVGGRGDGIVAQVAASLERLAALGLLVA